MRFRAATLFAAIALAAMAIPSSAQLPQGQVGHQSNLVFHVKDLKFVVVDMGGKPKDLEVKETNTEIRIDLAADVLFDFDKATLRPAARDSLKQAASIIRDNAKGSTVRVDGYTDAKGSEAYNKRLSQKRAEAVRNWLTAKEGLSGVTFATQGLGAKDPVAPNTKSDGTDNPDGRQKNRRVVITVKKG